MGHRWDTVTVSICMTNVQTTASVLEMCMAYVAVWVWVWVWVCVCVCVCAHVSWCVRSYSSSVSYCIIMV